MILLKCLVNKKKMMEAQASFFSLAHNKLDVTNRDIKFNAPCCR